MDGMHGIRIGLGVESIIIEDFLYLKKSPDWAAIRICSSERIW